MRFLKLLACLYPLCAIITFGHAVNHFNKEAQADCAMQRIQNSEHTCYSFELVFRPEAMLFSLLWPYYWSERLWEEQTYTIIPADFIVNTGAKHGK